MKSKKYKVCLFFILLTLLPSVTLAKSFTSYQENLRIEIPDKWTALTVEDKGIRNVVLMSDIRTIETKPPIVINSYPIPEFQKEAELLGLRNMISWPNDRIAEFMKHQINKINSNSDSTIIMSSKIISSPNNKSIFIIHENNSYRELVAITLINGIRYDLVTKIPLPYKVDFKDINDTEMNYPEVIIPIFLDIVKSIKSAY